MGFLMNKIINALIALIFLSSNAFAVCGPGASCYIKYNTLADIGGNVGINTTTASQKLEILGNAKVSGFVGANNIDVGGIARIDTSDRLVAKYNLEDNAANTTVTDETGNHNGVASGNTNAFTATGKLSQGFVFAANRTVTIASANTINFAGDFSIGFWYKCNSSTADVIMGNRKLAGNQEGWQITTDTSGQVGFSIDTGSANPNIIGIADTNDNTFHHVFAIRRSGVGELWIDGVSVGTPSASFAYDMTTIASPANTTLGGTTRNPQQFTGTFDDVRLYNGALSPAEIAFVVNSGTGTILTNNGITYQRIATTANAATSHSLSAKSDIYVEGKAEVDGTLYVDGGIIGDGSGLTGISSGGLWATVNTTDQSLIGGNVGIGTTATTTSSLKILKNGSTDYVRINSAAGNQGDVFVIKNNGNVGIGTYTPSSNLQVVGTVSATAFAGDGSGLTNIPSSSGGWTDGGTNVYTSTTTDNVGVGTTTPVAALEVENIGTQATFRVNDSLLDATPLIVTSNGNVGIGTSSPADKLVIGTSTSSLLSFDTAGSISLVNANSTVDLLNFVDNSLTTGNGIDISSSSSGLTAPLAIFNASNSANTSAVIQGLTAGTGVAIFGQNTGSAGLVAKFFDVAGDTTPFAVDVTGNVGIGTFTPNAHVDIRNEGVTPFMINSTATISTGDYFLVQSDGNVGVGTTAPKNTLQVKGTFQVDNVNSLGWSAISGANTACNTTCVSACVIGFDQGVLGVSLGSLVACSDATADECLCAGPS